MSEKSLQQANFERSAPTTQRVVYEGRTICVRNDMLLDQGNFARKWDIVVHPGAVAIIPITEQKKIILVKQWRRAAHEILLELPAGTLEKEEAADLCAQRELQEETGFKAKKLIPLGGFYSAPGFCTEYLYLFLAKELEESPLKADDEEAIDLIDVSLSEAWEMIEDGRIHDAKTIAGIARYEKWTQRS